MNDCAPETCSYNGCLPLLTIAYLCTQYHISDRTAIFVDQKQLPADSGFAMEIDASRDGLDYYVTTPQKVCPTPIPHTTPLQALNCCTSYYNAPVLFVCLLPIQISVAASCAAKRVMHAEGHLRCVLRGLACDYLPCGRRTCKVFLGHGTKTPTSPSQEGTP